MTTSKTSLEIASQPQCWEQALNTDVPAGALPAFGARVAVIGCGTSWFMAQAYAVAREAAGLGVTDAFTATEFPAGRDYDHIVTITRSGTTTEIIDLLHNAQTGTAPTTVITAVPGSPVVEPATFTILLPFADEESVVQTRFATTALALLRHSVGHDIKQAIEDAAAALTDEVPASWVQAEQISFLGTGWTVGLAQEAGLKLREASQSWTECYVAMEYRHGPISIAQPGRLVWGFGPLPAGLSDDIAATGAELVTSHLDPMAHLVLAQRLAVARAEARGLNPDTPRHLTRSVILQP